MNNCGNNSVKVTPLLSLSRNGAASTLIEINSVKILADCGSSHCLLSSKSESTDFEIAAYDRLKNIEIDVILLSHCDRQHIGALPYVFRILSKPPAILATYPVYKYGQLLHYDISLNNNMEESSNSVEVTLDDIDSAFDCILSLKYHQKISLETITQGKLKLPVSFCAFASGRTIGGSLWRIEYSSTDILYASDFTIRKEYVLDGLSLNSIPSSSLVITDVEVTEYGSPFTLPLRFKPDHSNVPYIEASLKALRQGGNVLIPMSNSGRLLEYLTIFSKHWSANSQLLQYKLVLLSPMAVNTSIVTKTTLEWVGESITKRFYSGHPHVLQWKNVLFCQNLLEMDGHCGNALKVVFATEEYLSWGLSKELLLRFADSPRNLIIFLETTAKETLATEIRRQHRTNLSQNSSMGHSSLTISPIVIKVNVPQRIPLEGEELDEFFRSKQRQKDAETERQMREAELKQLGVKGDEDDEDEDEDEEDDIDDQRDDNRDGNDLTDLITSDSHPHPSSNSLSVVSFSSDTSFGELKRTSSLTSSSSSALQPSKKRRVESIAKLLRDPRYPMFQTKEDIFESDEYGLFNDDLNFQDIGSIAKKSEISLSHSFLKTAAQYSAQVLDHVSLSVKELPVKIVPKEILVSLHCQILDLVSSHGVHTEVKSVKSLLTQVQPKHVLLLPSYFHGDYSANKLNHHPAQHGSASLNINSNILQSFLNYCRNQSFHVDDPFNGSTDSVKTEISALVSIHSDSSSWIYGSWTMEFPCDRVDIRVPRQLLMNHPIISLSAPSLNAMTATLGSLMSSDSPDQSHRSSCQLQTIAGHVQYDAQLSQRSGIATFVLIDNDPTEVKNNDSVKEQIISKDSELCFDWKHGWDARRPLVLPGERSSSELSLSSSSSTTSSLASSSSASASTVMSLSDMDSSPTSISVGEVPLDQIKSVLESFGVEVLYSVTSQGGMLICNSQIIVQKDEEQGSFVLEGPPGPWYYLVRDVLYRRFSFL